MRAVRTFVIAVACFVLASGTASAATIKGRVRLSGTPPEATLLNMSGDRACSLHPNAHSEEVIVSPEGMLKNVFVYAKSGAAASYPVPEEPVVLDQNGCRYEPHVLGVRVGQPLEMLNSDDTLHNVHAVAKIAKSFNVGMPIQGMRIQKTFDKPEVMVQVKCDVHPWMSGYVGVVDNPFYAVTGADGTFEIRDVPAGEYVFEIWHEKYGTQTQNVRIVEGQEPKTLEFEFNV